MHMCVSTRAQSCCAVFFAWFDACTASGSQCKCYKEFTIWFNACAASGKGLGTNASSSMSAFQCYHFTNLVTRYGACHQLACQCKQHSLR